MIDFKKANSEIDILIQNIDLLDKIVIDVGCGTGKLTRIIAKQCRYIYGVDLPDLIIKAKESGFESNVGFRVGTGEDLPFSDNFADIILFFASFHHIPENMMGEAILECLRVLKNHGIVCFVEPIPKEDSFYDLSKMIDDEAEIQKKAYKIITSLTSQNFTHLLESMYYLERSFKDFENNVNVYVSEESRRIRILKNANDFLAAKNINASWSIIKSYCRLNVLEKNIINEIRWN